MTAIQSTTDRVTVEVEDKEGNLVLAGGQNLLVEFDFWPHNGEVSCMGCVDEVKRGNASESQRVRILLTFRRPFVIKEG